MTHSFNRYFKLPANLLKLRNIVCCYVWGHLSEGYSQGMCDLLAPIMVIVGNEPLTFACFLKLMEKASKLFPPSTGMNTRLANLQSLLQVCVEGLSVSLDLALTISNGTSCLVVLS